MIRLATITLSVLALAFSGMAGLPSCLLADVVFGTDVCPCSRAYHLAATPQVDGADVGQDARTGPPCCPHCHPPDPAKPTGPADPAVPDPDQPGHDGGSQSCIFSHGQPIMAPAAAAELVDWPIVWLPFRDLASAATPVGCHAPARVAERGPPAQRLADGITLPLLT